MQVLNFIADLLNGLIIGWIPVIPIEFYMILDFYNRGNKMEIKVLNDGFIQTETAMLFRYDKKYNVFQVIDEINEYFSEELDVKIISDSKEITVIEANYKMPESLQILFDNYSISYGYFINGGGEEKTKAKIIVYKNSDGSVRKLVFK